MNINDFIDPHNIRIDIRKPFNFLGKTIATDGWSMIIMPECSDFNRMPEKYKNVVTDIMNKIEKAEFTKLTETFDVPERSVCHICNGRKKALILNCEECDEAGEIYVSNAFNDYLVTCKSCGGSGDIIEFDTDEDCSRCKGKGSVYIDEIVVSVRGFLIDYRFLDRIIDTDNDVEIAVLEEDHMLLFRSGEITGAIKGLRE